MSNAKAKGGRGAVKTDGDSPAAPEKRYLRYVLPIGVFAGGMCTMALELVGARVLAPFFGTALYTWAGLIGVIMGSMSIGYYLGGKLADKVASAEVFSLLFSAAALLVGIVGAAKNAVLFALAGTALSNAAGGLLASLLLFALPSLALAMISPYAVKLSMKNVASAGSIAGNLYAVGSLGSIVGTFGAAFILIPSLGNALNITLISIALALLSFIVPSKKYLGIRLAVLGAVIVCAFGNGKVSARMPGAVAERDTLYGTVIVRDSGNVRIMMIGNGSESGRYLDSEDLVFEYTKYYDLAFHFQPDAQKTLCLGGAGYSYPRYFLQKHGGTIDVVEIDPVTTELAREYFGLTDDPRLEIIHRDARSFLSENTEQYDAIFGDAFNSITPPYELLTLEAFEQVSAALTGDGVFILNTISALAGEDGRLFQSVYATLEQVFPQLHVFLPSGYTDYDVQNIIIVALRGEQPAALTSGDPAIARMLGNRYEDGVAAGRVLTDDYAPVEYMTAGFA